MACLCGLREGQAPLAALVGELRAAWGCAGAPLPACGAESTLGFLEAGGTLPTDTWSSLLASRTSRLPLFILPHTVLILSKRGPRGLTFSAVHICLPCWATPAPSPGLCPFRGTPRPSPRPWPCMG